MLRFFIRESLDFSSDSNKAMFMDSIINLDAINSLKGIGEPGLFNRLVDLFSETGLQQVNAIQSAFREKNWTKLSAEAHSFKSSAQSLGADALALLCEKLEQTNSNLETKSELVGQLDQVFQLAITELQSHKDPN